MCNDIVDFWFWDLEVIKGPNFKLLWCNIMRVFRVCFHMIFGWMSSMT